MSTEESDVDAKQCFSLSLCAAAEDIDGLGHVNNGVYVGWCQDAGWQHSVHLGLNLDSYHALDAAMVIRHADYDYIAAAYLGEACTMTTWLSACDQRLLMERRFELRRNRDAAILLKARWQLVCIRLSNGKARRMPQAFVDHYGPAVIPG